MSQPYRFNFRDMGRFIDDFNHIVQTGGARFLQTGGSPFGIVSWLQTAVALLLIAVIILVLYYLIFKGYYRSIVNLLTFSVFHKEDMDNLLRQDLLFENCYNGLLGESGYAEFSKIYGTQDGQALRAQMLTLKSDIASMYARVKPAQQLYEAFRDYYVYYDKPLDAKPKDYYVPIPGPNDPSGGEAIAKAIQTAKDLEAKQKGSSLEAPAIDGTIAVRVPAPEFYNQMLGVFVNKGLYDPKGKGDDMQMIEIYAMNPDYKRVEVIRRSIDLIAKTIRGIVDTHLKTPYLSYVVLPNDPKDYAAIEKDVSTHKDKIVDPSMYSQSIDSLNTFSWTIIEILQYAADANLYSRFSSEVSSAGFYNSDEEAIVRKYINLPPEKRGDAVLRVFGRDLGKRDPAYYDQIEPAETSDGKSTSLSYLEFMAKRPLFAHVYFSNEEYVKQNREAFYNRVMDIFWDIDDSNRDFSQIDVKTYLQDLVQKIRNVRLLVTNMQCFDLYLNAYRSEITRIYQDQNFTDRDFFKKLFNPFFDDFVKNRMLTRLKKTFSARTWQESYDRFRIVWEGIGKTIGRMLKTLPKTFG